jgi:hypothetical protein
MFTAGVSPASTVRPMWASVAAQSIRPSAVHTSSTADIPVIVRPGRIRASTSDSFGRSAKALTGPECATGTGRTVHAGLDAQL